MLKKIGFGLFLSIFFIGLNAKADTLCEIAAVVNNTPITLQDVDNRIKFATLKELPDNPKILKDLRGSFLKILIDEEIKKQITQRYQIKVTRRELNESLKNIATKNGMTIEDIKAELFYLDIPESTMTSMVYSNIAWNKAVNSRYNAQIRVTDAEIDSSINRFKNNRGKSEYLIQMINLPARSKKDFKRAEKSADIIFDQLSQGIAFKDVAKQYSNGFDEDNGKLKWVQKGDVQSEVEEVLTQLRPRQFSKIIKTRKGLTVIYLVKKQAIPLDAKVPEREEVAKSIKFDKLVAKSVQSLKQIRQTMYIDNRFETSNKLATKAK